MRPMHGSAILLSPHTGPQNLLVLGAIVLVALALLSLPFLGLLAADGATPPEAAETEDARPRRLLGTSVSGYQRGVAIVMALLAVGLIAVDGWLTDWDAVSRGRLAWPVLQWALMTPPGALVTVAVGAVPLALLLAYSQRNTWRRALARAEDVTDQPVVRARPPQPQWPPPIPTRRRRHRTPEERFATAGIFIIPLVLSGFGLCPLAIFIKTHHPSCYAARCPELPVMAIPTTSYILGFSVALGANWLWLRAVETRAGVMLRYNQPAGNLIDYVRRPETPHEPAHTALTRLVPSARGMVAHLQVVFPFTSVLFAIIIGAQIASLALMYWFQLHWAPA